MWGNVDKWLSSTLKMPRIYLGRQTNTGVNSHLISPSSFHATKPYAGTAAGGRRILSRITVPLTALLKHQDVFLGKKI